MAAVARVSLTIGIGAHPSVRALIDGTVKPEGIDLTCIHKFPEPSVVNRHAQILSGQLDGGEVCAAAFTEAHVNRGKFVGVPAFLYRSFRHRAIYCRDGAGITTPADLKGKRVGLHQYTAATIVWGRGILHDEYGVDPRDVHWFTLLKTGVEAARSTGVTVDFLEPPGKGIDLHPYLAGIMQRGELDAVIGPVNLTRPGITRLFPDHAPVEAAYYQRTGVFPIIHTTVINEAICQEHPWVPGSLLAAFRQAAALTPRYTSGNMERNDREVWEIDRAMLNGQDAYEWAIGERERRTIETFVDYLVRDGLITRRPSVDELYPVS